MIANQLVSSRCERYQVSDPLSDLWNSLIDPYITSKCEAATSLMFKFLDIKTEKDSEGYLGRAIFSSKLVEILSQADTTLYLTTLLNNYNKGSNFSLFDSLAKGPLNLGATKSLEFIAVMFQDTNALQHVYYLNLLQKKERWSDYSIKSKNLKLLTEFGQILQGKLAECQYNRHCMDKNLSYYPMQANLDGKNFQPAIYHFYIPAYLSYKLRLYGHGYYASFITPLALRVLYEQLFSEKTDFSKLDSYLIALGDREPAIASKYKQIDLYLSLIGISWALQIHPSMTFDDFAKNSSTNMPKTLRLLTKNL